MSEPNAALLAPIAGDNPSGASLRYDAIYEQIKEARREDDGMPQGDWQTARKVADWNLVIRLAADALTKKTKDLQIAAWLTEAWLRREGFAGLQNGLHLMHGMLEQYWDTVYPEIDEDGDADMRAAPLAWVGLKLDLAVLMVPLDQDGHTLLDLRGSKEVPTREQADSSSDVAEKRERLIADGRVPPEDVERAFAGTPKAWYRALVDDIDGCAAAVDALDTLCNERFEDPPSFIALRNVLRDVRQAAGQLLARKLEQDPDPEPVEDFGASAGSGDGPSLSEAVAAPDGAAAVNVAAGPASAQDAGSWVVVAARRLRQEQPTAPAPYLLLRALRWGELRAGGGIDQRLLAAPPTEVRTRLKTLMLDAAWPQLLNAAEEAMAQPYGRGWLDLQRYTMTAVAGLGSEYEAVGTAVSGALRTLLADLPELLGHTLMDDSPTANAETRAWLQAEKLVTEGTLEDEQVMAPRSTTLRRDPWEVAQARVRAGDAKGAMELLMREAMQEKSARARFLRRAQAAEVMVGAGMEPVALPILRELLALVEQHRLEEWEAGDTVAQPLALAFRCARRLGGDLDADSLYERICRLDPIRAIQIQAAAGPDSEG